MSCTIGARILDPGREFILFKNKDLPRESFEDQLVIEPNVFGVAGLHIPFEEADGEDVRSGFSIGANSSGVCACNSHVRSIEHGENYDLLTEAAVRGTASTSEACETVLCLAESWRYNWSNTLIADPGTVALVEVADDVAQVIEPDLVVRANEHLLAHGGSGPAQPCPRGELGLELLRAATCPEDVMALCRSHEREEEGANICAHGADGKRNTVYSYIMHWREGELTLLVSRGHPCEGHYLEIPLRFPLGARELARVYPTGWSWL
jgi:hypothetical protein